MTYAMAGFEWYRAPAPPRRRNTPEAFVPKDPHGSSATRNLVRALRALFRRATA